MKLINSLQLFVFGLASVGFAHLPAASAADKAADKGEVRAEIVDTMKLIDHRRTPGVIRLEKTDGTPVEMADLNSVDGAPLQLLAIDPGLRDFQHIFPMPSEHKGEYLFTITPQTDCSYMVWADIDPAGGQHQFVPTMMSGANDCDSVSVSQKEVKSYEDGHFKIKMAMDSDSLQVGQETTLKFTVRTPKGRYVRDLIETRGSFAHMVAFYDDKKTVTYLTSDDQKHKSRNGRGGPSVSFKINPVREGQLKMFVEMNVGNVPVLAAFSAKIGGVKPDFDNILFGDLPVHNSSMPDPNPDPSLDDKSTQTNSNSAWPEVKVDVESVDDSEDSDSSGSDDTKDLFGSSQPKKAVKVYEDPESKILNKDQGKMKLPSDILSGSK